MGMNRMQKMNDILYKIWVVVLCILAIYLLVHNVYPDLSIPFVDDFIGIFGKEDIEAQ